MTSIIAFSNSKDDNLTQMIANQLAELNLPIVYEVVNELDHRYSLYFSDYRFPRYVIVKNNLKKASINAKLSNEDLLNWINANIRY